MIGSSAVELTRRVHAREVSAVEVTQAHLDRIAAADGAIGAVRSGNGLSPSDSRSCRYRLPLAIGNTHVSSFTSFVTVNRTAMGSKTPNQNAW